LVGTAFDYLFRFYLKRLNPDARTSSWVAEQVPSIFQDNVQSAIDSYTLDRWTSTGRNSWLDDMPSVIRYRKRRFEKAGRILAKSKEAYAHYLKYGRINEQLLKSVLLLAQLDPFYRSGQDEYELGTIDRRDIQDLQALIGLVDQRLFKAKKICVLNPTFGTGSHLVGGADADLLIDNMLVEVKTTKHLQVRRDHWNQLIGYYLLMTIGGIDGVKSNYKVQRLGIYFSRFGELLTFAVDDAINQKKFRPFVRWFINRAREEQGSFLF
jgi:hypothetical protein